MHKAHEAADVARLENNRLFAGIPKDLLNEIGSDMDLLRFDKGDIIFNEGDPGDCLYLVCEGAICISKMGRGGKQETLGFIQPGNFFGEMALIDGQPRSAQAMAVEATLLGRVDHCAFERILAIAPRDLHMNFLRSVVERLRGLNAHFISELMRSERVTLVGSMANSIIHDLKNPICIIRSCAELMAKRVPDQVIKDYTKAIDRAVDNMLDMIQEMLDFARGQSSLQLERHFAHEVMHELDAQMTRLVPDEIVLMRDCDASMQILVDVGRFARMLLNLVKNSIEAMPNGGILRIAVRKQGAQVMFRISDTGCGIEPELQAKIFEPFVTFGKSKGTGLGMAIVKSVVEAHGGTISVHSEVGVGTSIEVSVAEAPSPAGAAA
jgi:signal transduction histidine kinase